MNENQDENANLEGAERGNPQTSRHYIIKSSVVGFFVVMYFIGKYAIPLPTFHVGCIFDSGFYMTEYVATILFNSPNLRHFLIILSSFSIDFMTAYFFFLFVFWGKSWRFPVSLALFYSTRFFIQLLFRMPYDKLYMYDYPGFPSLYISYAKYNDFFFSGHCGLPMICALESRKLKNDFLFFLSIINMASIALVLVTMRGHYSIDMISGIIVAHYYFKIVDKYLNCLDNSFMQIETEESRQYEQSINKGYKTIKSEEELKHFPNDRTNTSIERSNTANNTSVIQGKE